MSAKSNTALAVGVVMCLVLLSTLFVMDDDITTEETVENVGMPFTKAGGDHTIVITSESITFDGAVVNMSQFPGSSTSYPLIYGEKSFIRWGTTNIIIVSDTDGLHSFTVGVNTITLTISGTTATASSSATATTYSIDDVMFHISPSGGEYTLAINPYVNDRDVIYCANDTYYASSSVRPAPIRIWNVWNAVNGEISVESCGTSSNNYSDLTVSDTVVDYSNVESNLYTYASASFDYTVTYTGGSEDVEVPLSATYTYFLVPTEATYERQSNIAYFGVIAEITPYIPLFIILAIIMAVAGLFFSRKDYYY